MRLVTLTRDGDEYHVGSLVGDQVADLTAIDGSLGNMVTVIERADAIRELIGKSPRYPLDEVRLCAPLIPHKNVLAVGRNYVEHVHEIKGRPLPEHPIVFTKPRTSIIGPDDPIDTGNDPSDTTDYEGELGVVIGESGIRIPHEKAWDHVFGYTIINDVTARSLQRRHGQWLIGKGPDTFCPMGPWIVTRDEIEDLASVWIRTTVNGEERQAAPISDMIFDIPTLIETLSAVMTLEPGDVIATGTPAGVGMGMDPPSFLVAGDVVEISIDGIGTLTNPVI